MNERIKELAKRSGFFFHNAGYFPIEHTVPAEYSEKCFERFAELIVKETMQVVANQLPSNVYLDVADAVIKHFESK
jgi:hypothetical protein